MDAEPTLGQNSEDEDTEVLEVAPVGGLAGVLDKLRQQGQARMEVDERGNHGSEEFHIREYLEARLETVACLKYWERLELDFGAHKVKAALCRLAK